MLKLNLVILATFAYFAQSQNCASKCLKCPNLPQCQQCQPGYFLVNNQQCRPCPPNCKTCKLQNNNPQPVCIECSKSASPNNMCIDCIPSCKQCSGTPNNCTSCKVGLTLKNNGTISECVENQKCNKIAHCNSCFTGTQQICENCEINYYSFRRGCDKCKEPCQECTMNMEKLWMETVGPFWNQSRMQLQKMIQQKSNSAKRLLQIQIDDQQNQGNNNNTDNGTNHNNQTNNQTDNNNHTDNQTDQNNRTNNQTDNNNRTDNETNQNNKTDNRTDNGTDNNNRTDNETDNNNRTDNRTEPNNRTDNGTDNNNRTDNGTEPNNRTENETDNNNNNREYSQNYKNWTLAQWNASKWANIQLLSYSQMNPTQIKGWTQAYFFFKAAQTRLPQDKTLTDLMYNCLPIVEQILNLTYKNQNQWKHLARFLSTYSSSRWSGPQLDAKISQLASDKTSCFKCSPGFVLDSVEGKCMKCDQNCQECTDEQCLMCSMGYFMDQDTGKCMECQSTCLECSIMADNCTLCLQPLTLSQGKCVECQSPCLTCSFSNLSLCTSCVYPFSLYPNSTQQCFKCSDSDCLYCNETNLNSCFSCQQGSVLSDGQCQSCQQDCKYCGYVGQQLTCFQCSKGYTLKDGQCMQCSQNCSDCFSEDTNTCKDCKYGSFINVTTGQCMKCPKGCKDCMSNDTCMQYQDGVVIYDDQVVQCQLGCMSCNASNPNQCLLCNDDGFYLSTGICMLCPPNCQKCTNRTTCTSCRGKDKLSQGQCISCSKSCKQCNPNNMTQCVSCPRGLTLNNGTCINSACQDGCISCNSANTSLCNECDRGYGLRGNGKCIRCVGKCTGKCNPLNISECLSCMQGFYIVDGQCVRCPEGCSICTSNTSCSNCYQGYTFNPTSSSCAKKCLFPCTSCQSTACDFCATGYIKQNGKCLVNTSCNPQCTTCLSGSQQNPTTLQCTRCPQNCATCKNGTCSACFQGYYLDGSNVCVRCDDKCFTCYDVDNCKICAEGYTKEILSAGDGFVNIVFGQNCVACSSNCKTCSIYKNRCTSCREGFRLKGQKCIGRYTVVYKYQLDYDFNKFLQNSQSETFTKNIAKKFNNDTSRNSINSIRKGSTVVQGQVSADSGSQATQIQQQLATTTTVGTYKVLASNVAVAYDDQAVNNTNGSSYQGNPEQFRRTGIVVGSVVGGIVLILLIVTAVCCCRKKTGTSYAEETHVENQVRSDENGNPVYPTSSQDFKYGTNHGL